MDEDYQIVPNFYIPPGLQCLYETCRNIYPNQPNPLQVSAVLKYWLGGPDPLDYISMYYNCGMPERNIPAHWHYVSFGLSDLHGDGRVHPVSSPGLPSGFGFELSFRVKKSPVETAPPTWPATLLQSLAKYVFSTHNALCIGDHVSWHSSLDGRKSSKIQHILLTKDPQLSPVNTPCGVVQFIQIVGICKEELEAAQKWNGFGVLNILKKIPSLGGEWLITDMLRCRNMFEVDSRILAEVENGIVKEGSNLSGVNCKFIWLDKMISRKELIDVSCFGNEFMKLHCPSLLSDDNFSKSKLQSLDNDGMESDSSQDNVSVFENLHLILDKEGGQLLPLITRGRLKHGRHFTFQSLIHGVAVTFVAPGVTGTGVFVNDNQPYVAYGPWLQIYLPESFIPELESTVDVFSKSNKISLPKTFYWGHRRLAITIVSEKDGESHNLPADL